MIEAGKAMFDAPVAPAQNALDADPAREPRAYEALVREIGEDAACEVRDVFWSESRARLQLFRTISLAQHHARIAREAHSLKSAAGTFSSQRWRCGWRRPLRASAMPNSMLSWTGWMPPTPPRARKSRRSRTIFLPIEVGRKSGSVAR